MDTPFQWTAGGFALGWHANPAIVHWPNGIEEAGGLRSQFAHVDLAPTIAEVAGLRADRDERCSSRLWNKHAYLRGRPHQTLISVLRDVR
jgi:arylsulfatase A-like enzyme